jgi:hypothetical protein
MNYIELINQFWQCDIEHSFNGSETRLYFYLLHTCNSLRWKNPFTHSDAHLAAVSGMSVNTLKSARNRLKQAGLIEFTSGSQGRGQSHKASYKLSIFDTFPDTLSANSLTVFPRTSDSINKHKLNEEEKAASADAPSSSLKAEAKPEIAALPASPAKPPRSPKKPKASADEVATLELPHPGEEFADLWAEFRAMPKQAKKPVTALRRLLATLGKYEEGFAQLMLEKAIEGNWAGVEFDSTPEVYAKWQAEQARRPSPPPAPTSFDPDELFGYSQSAADGLAQARQSPEYQRYLAEQAQAQDTQPADAALSHAA